MPSLKDTPSTSSQAPHSSTDARSGSRPPLPRRASKNPGGGDQSGRQEPCDVATVEPTEEAMPARRHAFFEVELVWEPSQEFGRDAQRR
jgi:hypothetical protein